MSTFKHINSSDIVITPYTANKQWVFSSSSLHSSGIEIYAGKNVSGSLFTTTTSSLSSSAFTIYSSSILVNSASSTYVSGAAVYISGNWSNGWSDELTWRYNFENNYESQKLTSSLTINWSTPPPGNIGYFNLYHQRSGVGTIETVRTAIPTGSAGTYTYLTPNIAAIQTGDTYLFSSNRSGSGDPIVSINLTGNIASSSMVYTSASAEAEYNGQYERLVYNQFKHLYYSNYVYDQLITGSRFTSATSSYDNFDMTTCASGSGAQVIKYFPTESNARVSAISIPQNLFGSSIKPGTFNIVMDQTEMLFDAFKSRVIADGGTFEADEWAIETIAELLGEEIELNIVDDYEGNLFANSNYVGNIVYPHGLVIFTSGSIVNYITGSDFTLSFKNEHTIYENEITCTVNEDEFNLSYNPTLLIDLSGSLQNFATSSQVNPYVVTQSGYFNPYVTTVGLYNDANELLTVAKMAQPVPLSSNIDTIFKIKYDR